MHYRNGREAKNGDKIVSLGFDNANVNAFGVLHSAVAGNDYCNGGIASLTPSPMSACLVDCLHVDDLAKILEEAGLNRRPPSNLTK